MTSTAATAESPRYKTEKVIDFDAATVAAPFFLRCAAVAIDYILLMVFPVLALMWDIYFGDGTTRPGPGGWTWTFIILFWIANFILFPLLRGQTIGKLLTGLTILNMDGTPVRLQTIVVRHLIGYALTVMTLGIGFFFSVFSSRGRALHDLITNTIVVKARRSLV